MLFFLILLLAFYITKPFLTPVITGAVVAYLSYPLYGKIIKFVKNKSAAALIVSIILILLITVPLISVLSLVSTEAYGTYSTLNKHSLGTNLMGVACKDENWLSCRSLQSLAGFLPEDDAVKSFDTPQAKLDYYFQATIKKITEFIIENFSKFLVSLPSLLLNFFVMVFVVYYLLKDGSSIAGRVKNILPLKELHKQKVLQRFHDLTYGAFYGSIFVAVVQGILGAVGFYLFNGPSPILWGFVMIFFALIPYFGTALIWLPAGLNLILTGYLQDNSSFIINGIALLIYGALVISTIDNFLKPKIIGAKSGLHPILVLLGVLGGLSVFGFIGLILGPAMLALLMTFVDIYEKEKGEIEKYF